jgi:DNA-binding transcriptional regulator GbsR (MarR family)
MTKGKSGKRSASKKTTRKKHWFTVQEDAVILKYLREHSGKKTKSEISKNLADQLKLSSESIRDRIKRYYSKLVAAHQNAIENAASVSGVFLLFLKRAGFGSFLVNCWSNIDNSEFC